MNIFVIDDQKNHRETLAQPFLADHVVRTAADLEEASRIIENWWPDVALVDAVFPKTRNGAPVFAAGFFLDLVESRGALYPELPQTIIVSGENDAAKRFEDVRQWLKDGRIADVIPKSTADVGVEFFRAVVQLRVETLLDRQRWRVLQNSAESSSDWFARLGIITRSPRVLALKTDLMAAANSSACVLLKGKTGCGKELFAKAIHSLARRGKPYNYVDCSQIPTELFESEMFGIKGYGQGNNVYQDVPGVFKTIGEGTIFLDEIQDLKWEHQGKLRHVLQERRFRPVGAREDIPFHGKLVAAANKPLRESVEAGTFREDLYYRVAGFEIAIPDLVDRMEDIPYLAEYFLKELVRTRREDGIVCPNLRLHPKCLAPLSSFNWQGNVRELRSVIEKVAEFALVECQQSEGAVEINIELLAKRVPSLGAALQNNPYDRFLASCEIGVERWSELDESTSERVAGTIETLLSEEGLLRFRAMQLALLPRDLKAGENSPGRDTQDPALINCLKALLYLLLQTDNRASIQDFLAIMGLRSWDSAKKVMKVLAGEHPGVSGYSPFLNLPSRKTRQMVQLLDGIVQCDAGSRTH